MKKLLALLLLLTLALASAFSLVSCVNTDGKNDETQNTVDDKTPATADDETVIRIGVMAGPTGMGMAALMQDETKAARYDFRVYSDPSIGVADLSAGKLDMLCLPTNTAANLYAKTGAKVLAINCLGSLYLVTGEGETVASLSDLEGKTVYTSVPGSTTGPILSHLLSLAGVHATIETVADHDSLVAKVAKGEASIAVLPEPKVTALTMQNSAVKVALNLSSEWENLSESPLTMGCIVVRDAFLGEHRAITERFVDDYKASIEYIGNKENHDAAAQMIVDAGVLPKLPIANKALTNLYGSIVYLDGAEMKAALEGFYDAIGQAKPADAFYFSK